MLHLVRRDFPLWLTVTAHGPTVSLAVLPMIEEFGLTEKTTVALPAPLATEGTSQLWLGMTAHVQPAPV